jgi:putative hemolysin
MNTIATEVLIIILLLAANGVFAMTEIAVVSARKTRLRRLADSGDLRAKAALELAQSPSRFLATVQVGITLVGVLAGAFGGATLAEQIAVRLESFPWIARYAEAIGIGTVVLGITFLSLILGELVPKRIGLNNPERIARFMAGPMNSLARLAKPLVWLLTASTELVLRLIRLKKPHDPPVTEEEVKVLIREGVQAGVFDRREPAMVEGVLAFDRLPVRDIMTPRAKLVFLNKDDPHEAVWHKVVVSGHSNFPVYEGSRDHVVGVVAVKAIYANLAAGVGVRLVDLMTPPLLVPASQTVSELLDIFKQTRRHIALVTGGGGTIGGLVTLVDVLEAIVGEIPSMEDRLKPEARRRDDGSWLVDGRFEMTNLAPLLGGALPATEGQSVAAFVAAQLASEPREGASFVWLNYRFEIIDMDRQRIDKVLIMP